ncbi:MAG TPA: methyltransferase domain-containing protein [Gemmatimonadales bacterium]|nr:methyltransferase domain-containing protein [Gemmatimonadales bacterium]
MTRLSPSPTGTELLDDVSADSRLVEESLGNIARANRWFGGLAAVRHGLARLLRGRIGPVTLLDVGTGGGDVPRMARAWCERQGMTLLPFGLERHPAAARLAHEGGLQTSIGCGGSLPLRDAAVDVVVLSQVAHHLDADSCVAVFRECDRVARIGVIVADLHRSVAAQAGFWVASHALGFDRVTRVDGMTSLRRGFTTATLRQLLQQTGVDARVERRPGFRLVATWNKAMGPQHRSIR